MIDRLPCTPDSNKLTTSYSWTEDKPLQVKREVPSGITPWPWVPLQITHMHVYIIATAVPFPVIITALNKTPWCMAACQDVAQFSLYVF